MQSGIVGIDHVAVVTRDLNKARAFYRSLGLRTTKIVPVTEQFLEEAEPHRYKAFSVLFPDSGPVLWIMEPQRGSGPLRRFLSRNGPGLHHVGLRVKETEIEEARISKKGIRFIRISMRDGTETRALIDPHDSDSMLIELVQRNPVG